MESYPEELNQPHVKSLLKKHLTREVYEELKGRKSKRGTTVGDIIKSGVVNLDSGVGAYVGDEESYTLFSPLLNPIIEEYHAPFKVSMVHPTDTDISHIDCPDPDPEGKLIRSTRIRVARNIRGYGLSPTVTKEERLEIEHKVVAILTSMTGDLEGTYHPLTGMDAATYDELVACHFLFKKGDRFMEAAGSNRDWPEGRGIFYNKSKTFLVWVNEEDHLRIISMEKGSDIQSVFRRLCQAAGEIEQKLEYQSTANLGYLTSCPTNLGTGMRASVHIKIPKAQSDPRFKAICKQYHIQARGVHGEHSVSTGEDAGVYDVSNERRLGLSEVQCVQDMYDGIRKLMDIELEK